MPGIADIAAVDVQHHSRFLSAHECGGQGVVLTPVGRLGEAVGAPMLSQAGQAVGVLGRLWFSLPRVVSTRHLAILVAGRARQATNRRPAQRPRRALDSTEGDKGSNPARRGSRILREAHPY